MNLKKLAILLGITALCSLADAKAKINVTGAQSAISGVDTSNVQATNDAHSGSNIGLTIPSGTINVSTSKKGQDKTNINNGKTKVVMNGNTQGATHVNTNLP